MSGKNRAAHQVGEIAAPLKRRIVSQKPRKHEGHEEVEDHEENADLRRSWPTAGKARNLSSCLRPPSPSTTAQDAPSEVEGRELRVYQRNVMPAVALQ